jgi:hypothetical protein
MSIEGHATGHVFVHTLLYIGHVTRESPTHAVGDWLMHNFLQCNSVGVSLAAGAGATERRLSDRGSLKQRASLEP